MRANRLLCGLVQMTATLLFAPSAADADVITDWNARTGEWIVAAGLGPPPANRLMAIVHTAAYEAANAISKRYPGTGLQLDVAPGASIDAAVAAAYRAVLTELVPSQRAAVDTAYRNALSQLGDDGGVQAGIAVGEKAAGALLAAHAGDGAATQETYRPYTAAGVYVPTVVPAVSQWPQRKPWLMTSAAQFRPGPPPALTSERWARDYNEIKALGARNGARRSEEQTAIARFWEATLPPIYHGLVRCVALMPGRDVTQNARLFAAVTQATDDALVAVFDAKYHYNFWRPITAIRNGDNDGNDATERDAAWLPFIETPMHPEYPCAHCIVSATVATVLSAEVGNGPQPAWTTTSSTAKGAARNWPNLEAVMQEVANARIYDGVHYRYSTEVGTAMGRQVGMLAVAKLLRN